MTISHTTLLQLANAGDDVLLFYNDHAFPTLVQLMKVEKGDKTGVCVCGGGFGVWCVGVASFPGLRPDCISQPWRKIKSGRRPANEASACGCVCMNTCANNIIMQMCLCTYVQVCLCVYVHVLMCKRVCSASLICLLLGDLAYHTNLVDLLTMCTEGKNVATEIKCTSLLPLDEIVRVVTDWDCIPEVCGWMSGRDGGEGGGGG